MKLISVRVSKGWIPDKACQVSGTQFRGFDCEGTRAAYKFTRFSARKISGPSLLRLSLPSIGPSLGGACHLNLIPVSCKTVNVEEDATLLHFAFQDTFALIAAFLQHSHGGNVRSEYRAISFRMFPRLKP